jgi:hypothetical protein
MRKTLLLYPAALLATFRACRDWLVDCRDSLTDDGWREGDDLGANIGRWIARSYAFRFLMFFVTVIMFGIGLAVTEFAKPYTGESAAMVIGLSALFAPLIAWVWIGYFRDPPRVRRRVSRAASSRSRAVQAAAVQRLDPKER